MNKIVKTIFFVCLFIFSVSLMVFHAFANLSELETSEMTGTTKETILESIDLKVSTTNSPDEQIIEFSINPNGLIAIACEGNLNYRGIMIYDENMNFIRKYDFKTMGNYHMTWDGDNLVIILVRSDAAIWIDENGTVVNVANVVLNTAEGRQFLKNLESAQRTVGEKTYKLTNGGYVRDFISTSYSQLILTDENGNETCLYGKPSWSGIWPIVLVVPAIALGIAAIVRFVKKSKETQGR